MNADTNPILAEVLGLKRPPTAGRKKATTREEETAKATTILKDLESLSMDEVRARLQDEDVSLSELRRMALLKGIRDTESLNREAIVHQIVTKIANFRGYQRLGEQQGIESDSSVS